MHLVAGFWLSRSKSLGKMKFECQKPFLSIHKKIARCLRWTFWRWPSSCTWGQGADCLGRNHQRRQNSNTKGRFEAFIKILPIAVAEFLEDDLTVAPSARIMIKNLGVPILGTRFWHPPKNYFFVDLLQSKTYTLELDV